MTPKQKKDEQKEFADFLRASIQQPIKEIEIPKEFYNTSVTFTVATIRNYCSRILTENQDVEKINRIKQFYNLKSVVSVGKDKIVEMNEIDKLLLELETSKDNAKAVVLLFQSKTVSPSKEILSFAAFLINFPCTTVEEFRQWKIKNPHLFYPQNNNKVEIESTTEVETENKIENKTENKIENTTEVENNNPKIVIETPKTFFQKHKYKFTIAASIILLLVCSAYAYNLQSYINTNKEKLAMIEQISFKPILADSGLVENTTKPTITSQNIGNQVVTKNSNQIIANIEMPLSFYTNNIYNGKFLFTTDKWNFETDSAGEDMNSKYGEPYQNQLKSLQKLPNTQPTIANKNIWIRFNIMNKSNTKLYVDNIKLEKVATHRINNKVVKWSNWITPKDGEKRFELALSHVPQIVAVVPFAEIAANSPQHFSLVINCDKTCENYIYKFKLVVSANDGQGNRYNVSSDRVYMLGLVSEL